MLSKITEYHCLYFYRMKIDENVHLVKMD